MMVILSMDVILLILTQLFYFRLFGGLIYFLDPLLLRKGYCARRYH